MTTESNDDDDDLREAVTAVEAASSALREGDARTMTSFPVSLSPTRESMLKGVDETLLESVADGCDRAVRAVTQSGQRFDIGDERSLLVDGCWADG